MPCDIVSAERSVCCVETNARACVFGKKFFCAYLEHYGIHAQKPPQTVETGHVSLANNAVGSL